MTTPWAGREPRRWQTEALDAILGAMRSGTRRPLVQACTGCHEAGQLVLMADGSTKTVEDVIVGDQLMGPDSTPRKVLSLCRGADEMFEVRPVKGQPWRVNRDHVLSLVDTRGKYDGRIRDVTLSNWSLWCSTDRHMFKLFRVGVDFPPTPTPLVNPYFVGLLIGDGSTLNGQLSITTMDEEVVTEIKAAADQWGCQVRISPKANNRASSYHLHYDRGASSRGSRQHRALLHESQLPLIRFLRSCGLTQSEVGDRMGVSFQRISEVERGKTYIKPAHVPLRDALYKIGLIGQRCECKRVPPSYRIGSRQTRLEILAGLLDTDGSLTHSGFDFISKSSGLAEDVTFIARSLGLAAYVSKCQKSCQTGTIGTYFRVSISGDLSIVPTRIARKRAHPRKQIKSVLRTGFDIVPLGYRAPYFGFVLDGDRRYLLDDFTVTHNSGKSAVIGEVGALCKGRVLVTTPTQALVEQLSETLDERCPGEVGQAYQHAWQTDRRIVVTCTASLLGLLEERKAWDCWIADETHKAESEQARATRPEVKVAVGLTATPYRSDERGLEYWDRCVYAYTSADAVRDGVLVPWRVVRWDGEGDSDTDTICRRWIAEAHGPGIVSAISIEDAERFAASIDGVETVHSHLPRPERRARIERLRRGETRALVHVALLVEGVDLPWLQWLMIRRPVSSPVRLVQEVGRVLRCAPGKSEAVLYDPHDCLGAVGLTHAAQLEDGLVRGKGKAADAWEIPELAGVGDLGQIPRAVAVDRLSGWVCDLLGTLRGAGLAEPPSHGEGPWRQQRASEKQRACLGRLVWAKRYLPDPGQRRAIDWMASQEGVRSGTASDLISVLRALAEGSKSARERRTHWHIPVALPAMVGAPT